MATATKTPRIQSTPDGEARCAHADCWGNVCPDCFAKTPFLQDVYGRTYTMNGTEYLGDDAPPAGVSPATPTVEVAPTNTLLPGDRVLGYTKDARKPLIVASLVPLPQGAGITSPRGTRTLITDATVAVVRAN